MSMEAVKYYMEESMLTITPDSSALEASRIMKEAQISSLVVEENGSYIGLLTEGDLSRKIVALEKNPKSTRIREVMSHPIISIDGEKPMPMAFVYMRKYNVRHLGVTSGNQVVGILSIKDFGNYFNYKFSSDQAARPAAR